MENQQNTSGNVDILQQALDRPVNIPCIHHDWVKHEDTLMEYCERCKVRKDEMDTENTIEKVENSTKPNQLQKGHDPHRNMAGRPPGSKTDNDCYGGVKGKVCPLEDEKVNETLKETFVEICI